MEERELLAEGLRRLRIECPPARLEALERYRLELERWNRRYGFVKASGNDLVVRHFLDSLAGLPVLVRLPARRTVLDVGSGAGLPGLPLALFLEDSQVALLERSARKAAFLANVAALLGLGNVRVLELELRGLKERFDLVTFRAWSPLGRELAGLRRVLAPAGVIAAYKGRRERIDQELKEAGIGEAGQRPASGWPSGQASPAGFAPTSMSGFAPTSMSGFAPLEAAVVPLEVPFLDEERHLVLLRAGLPPASR